MHPPCHVAPAAAPSPQRVLDTREAAQLLNIGPRLLQRMRAEGRGPVFVRLSERAIGYLPADIEAWLNARRQVGAVTREDAA